MTVTRELPSLRALKSCEPAFSSLFILSKPPARGLITLSVTRDAVRFYLRRSRSRANAATLPDCCSGFLCFMSKVPCELQVECGRERRELCSSTTGERVFLSPPLTCSVHLWTQVSPMRCSIWRFPSVSRMPTCGHSNVSVLSYGGSASPVSL